MGVAFAARFCCCRRPPPSGCSAFVGSRAARPAARCFQALGGVHKWGVRLQPLQSSSKVCQPYMIRNCRGVKHVTRWFARGAWQQGRRTGAKTGQKCTLASHRRRRLRDATSLSVVFATAVTDLGGTQQLVRPEFVARRCDVPLLVVRRERLPAHHRFCAVDGSTKQLHGKQFFIVDASWRQGAWRRSRRETRTLLLIPLSSQRLASESTVDASKPTFPSRPGQGLACSGAAVRGSQCLNCAHRGASQTLNSSQCRRRSVFHVPLH